MSRRAVAVWAVSAAVVASACSPGVSGTPVAAAIEPPTATESVRQSLTDLGEAAVLRYQGTMQAAGNHKATFDITAAGSGEMTGTLGLDGRSATVLVVDRSTFLKAAADFWATLPGIADGPSKGAAVADRWVKVPAGLIGVELADVFTPQTLGQNLAEGVEAAGDRPLTDGARTKVGDVEVVRSKTGRGAVSTTAKAPYGVVKVELDKAGDSDSTSVRDLVATVTDGSAGVAKFYQDFAAAAQQVTAPVDVLTTVQESSHSFEGCGAQSCSIVVQFTNNSKLAVKVSVRGTWQGDGAALGVCDAVTGPVAPGQGGGATCTLATPEWVGFFQRANSVPGNHPYSVQWSTLVLADPPDLSKVGARAAAKPADPGARKTEGSNFVYSIGYTEGGREVVWKYGSVATKFWAEHAEQQLAVCLGTTGKVCLSKLVTATDDAAAAQGLVKQLVDGYRGTAEACPAGQWVGCTS
ncbi:hypothetical protein L6E12_20745 [Actinokineospora sp. PR83]|uniref:hypothetical protein n=1 Tax=Actinokineospora sp. PR83 TaxID=2884908 RepID=UPI001F24AE4F|nr:hypothetical protein [Actinokineospora sp. PR83]MCG8918216.1 hypothetical protein [Actinokineospora sp. PR83]